MGARALACFLLLSCSSLSAHAQDGYSWMGFCHPTKQAACNAMIGFTHPTLGTVDGIFENGLPRECSIHWSTLPPTDYSPVHTGICLLSPPPIPVTIDPGHGFSCPAKGMAIGAVGVTNFPANNPPAGRLREDDLTMAIAREVQRILPTSKYRVVLTKRDANECPSFEKRGRIANKEKAKAFVSIHINSRLVVPFTDVPIPLAHGTSVLYNVEKSGSFNLAESMARAVSSSLGVNNRGVKVDDEIAVLKKTVTETKIAVLVEAARLSGEDETKLHASGSATRIAAGIKAALDESLGN